MNGPAWAILVGGLLAFGAWALAGLAVPVRPKLSDALDLLQGRAGVTPEPAGTGLDRIGSWLRVRSRRPVSAATLRRLRMAGRSLERHYAYKLIAAAAALFAVALAGAGLAMAFGSGAELPAITALVAGVAAFFLPDLLLRGSEADRAEDATEALLTYFDLVTLERMANASGSQALRAAAAMSDATVFAAIRDALERARLEQRAPYAELRRLGSELQLPALVDVADVISLDETGASLSGALRARVRELRDAHLTGAKIAAAEISERMAVFMVIPSLVFGLFFLVPPVLRLLSG